MKYNQTDKSSHRSGLAQTVKLSFNRSIRPSHSSKSKPTNKENTQKIFKKNSMLAKVITSNKNTLSVPSLKLQYDQLVNSLFLKIDFDYSGYISFTKISHCKQIPEKVFYFFGGVFQKVKHLGAITLKVFTSLCQEAYRHARRQDLQSILNVPPLQETVNNKQDHSKTLKIQFTETTINDENKAPCNKENKRDFSTKQRETLKLKHSLRIKTEGQQTDRPCFHSESKFRLPGRRKLKESDLLFQQSSFSEQSGVSFQSEKVKKLAQRLDFQIERNRARHLTSRFIY